jgi:hypothetical protein
VICCWLDVWLIRRDDDTPHTEVDFIYFRINEVINCIGFNSQLGFELSWELGAMSLSLKESMRECELFGVVVVGTEG